LQSKIVNLKEYLITFFFSAQLTIFLIDFEENKLPVGFPGLISSSARGLIPESLALEKLLSRLGKGRVHYFPSFKL
jgi:hypothetical protein